MPRHLALVRHGQSEYNASQRFTGWHDPPLTKRGEDEALAVAARLRALEAQFSLLYWRAPCARLN